MSDDVKFLVLLSCALLIGLVVWPRLSMTQQGPDAQAIAQLRKAGSDLSKLHPIEFFLYAPTAEAVDRLALKIRESQFEAKVRPAALGSQWLVLATKSLVPHKANLAAIRKQFTTLADAENGEYDGWGAPVIR